MMPATRSCPRSASIVAVFELFQKKQDPSPRRRKLGSDDIPHEIEIYTEVIVDELVSHARHLTPGHTWNSLSQIRRHALGGLADDLQISDDGVLNHRRDEELVPSRLRIRERSVDRVADME
jgi:hypothetical protein